MIQPESVAKLEANLLELDHGSVSVGTSKSFKVRVNCITVVPVLSEWTQYEVNNLNGNVQVAARKDDVNVEREIGSEEALGGDARRRMEPPFTRQSKKVSTNRRSAELQRRPSARAQA